MAEQVTTARLYFPDKHLCHQVYQLLQNLLSLQPVNTSLPWTKAQTKSISKHLETLDDRNLTINLYDDHILKFHTFCTTSSDPMPLFKALNKLGNAGAFVENSYEDLEFSKYQLIGARIVKPKDFLHFVISIDPQLAMILAITENYLGDLKKLAESAMDLDVHILGKTLLYTALEKGDRKIAQDILLAQRIDPNLRNVNKQQATPIFALFTESGEDNCMSKTSEPWLLDRLERLLKIGAVVDIKDSEGRTPLMLAAYKGHAKICQRLLDAGAKINDIDKQGRSALLYLLKGQYYHRAHFIGCLNTLVKNGVDLKIKDLLGRCAMYYACGAYQTEQAMLELGLDYPAGASILPPLESVDEVYLESIHWKIKFNQQDWLLSNVDTVYQYICQHTDSYLGKLNRVNWLIAIEKNHPDIRSKMMDKYVLGEAAKYGCLPFFEWLLNTPELFTDHPSITSNTLEQAARWSQDQCFILLLNRLPAACFNQLDDQHALITNAVEYLQPQSINVMVNKIFEPGTALKSAINRCDYEVFVEVCRHIPNLPKSTLLDVLNRAEGEKLSYAVRKYVAPEVLLKIGKHALEKGSDPLFEYPDNIGTQPLLAAAKLGVIELVEILLKSSPDIDQQNNKGRTALSYAAARNYPELVEYLLAQGANPNVKDKRGFLPYSYAKSKNRKRIMAMLEKSCVTS